MSSLPRESQPIEDYLAKSERVTESGTVHGNPSDLVKTIIDSGGSVNHDRLKTMGWTDRQISANVRSGALRWSHDGSRLEVVHQVRSNRTVVRDYIAVDPHGRPVAGPFTDYGDAKRAATRAAGYVKYATERTHRRRRTVR